MKKRGFTLVELMITLAIFSIFSVYLYQTFFSQIRQSFNFKNNIDIQYNANKALNMLTDEIRNYDSVNDTKILKSSDGDTVLRLGSRDENGKIKVSTVSNASGTNEDEINLISNASSNILYNIKSKVLQDKDENKCSNIDSVDFSYKDGLIFIRISASEGNIQIKSSTAINVQAN
ncbi:type II secretion system protein [Clostridium sp. AWRP]|uniref:PilW family protein n=1 Tax=Clostridium sp. AWRP TaxID=2212991 RepID=UPI000FDCC771|nr:type II secretion system protein [Clostridium sp. AWRP]AZV55568.1 prepilin-type N-terminal cleavage/methylation domain-containing protein [Clostridium sp. AWRP]